jgi:hypothetical protein
MTTNELIQKLKEIDPDGKLQINIEGKAIYTVELLPAYYDGDTIELIQDKDCKFYNVEGVKITDEGKKIRLFLLDEEDVIWNNPDAIVDLTGIKGSIGRERTLKRIEKLRETVRIHNRGHK